MATTTPNFGWTVPTSTDLVKDGATAIETLGDGIDASFVDLKGGTTGQVLAKASGTDLDYTWSTPSSGGGMTLLSTTALSGSTLTVSSISQSYKHLLVVVKDIYMSANDAGGDIRLNGDSGSNYTFSNIRVNNTTASYEAGISTELSNALFTNPSTNTATKKSSIMMNLYRYTDTGTVVGEVQSIGASDGSVAMSSRMPFSYASSAGVSSISFNTNTGTFSGGNVYIYGVN